MKLLNQKRLQRLREKLKEHHLDGYITLKKENREYLSQFTGTSGYVVVTENDAVLFTDFRYMSQAKQQTQFFDVIEHESSYAKTIGDWLNEQKISRLGFEAANVSFETYNQWRDQWNAELVGVADLVAELRTIKDEREIAIIQHAVDITDQAFAYLLGIIRPGMSEREVALELEMQLKKRGATHLAFDTIVASGVRSSMPHGVASDKLIESGDMVTIDFGAQYEGYCSDMTRTFVVGKANSRQKEIYDTVLTAQQRVLDNIKAGMVCKDVDRIARDYIYQQGYQGCFGHGLGHALGMEVHENPRLNQICEVILEPGMVVTVEPGIYIPEFGGVRIEDDVVIETSGCKILNKTPKEFLEI